MSDSTILLLINATIWQYLSVIFGCFSVIK